MCIIFHIEETQHGEIVVLQLNNHLQKALNRKQLSPVVTHQWQQIDMTIHCPAFVFVR